MLAFAHQAIDAGLVRLPVDRRGHAVPERRQLGVRFGRADMVKRFLDSRRTGFYMAVGMEGDVAAGDTIEILDRHPAAVSIPELLRMYLKEGTAPDRLRQVLAIPALSEAWRSELQKQVERR